MTATSLKANTARVRLRWPTMMALGLDAAFNVYASAAGGEVDYDTPLNPTPIEAWPADLAGFKTGFGLGAFGSGAFGFGDGGFGFGVGGFGLGPFGFGAGWLEYLTEPMADGIYTFAVCPVDAAGNVNTAGAIEKSLNVAGRPWPPTDAEITAYDQATDTLTVEWTPDNRNVIE